jgi:hypothetical protein
MERSIMGKPKRVTSKWITQRYQATTLSRIGDKFGMPGVIVVKADWRTERKQIANYLRKFGVNPGKMHPPPHVNPFTVFYEFLGLKRTKFIHFQVKRQQYKWARALLINAGYTLGELCVGGARFPGEA